MSVLAVGPHWRRCVDICEHHVVDFAQVARQDVDGVIVRSGRGTRQDAHWIEHVRASAASGLGVGSYWHLYPSHTDAHHQAELWMAAIEGARRWPFERWHWADITDADGFGPDDLRRYVAAFLRRMDALLGRPVGIFTSDSFWRHHVGFDDERPRWICGVHPIDAEANVEIHGVRTRASDRGGPGWHLARPCHERVARNSDRPHLVARGADEAVATWQARWIRSAEIVDLQERLNAEGATLLVDGVYGPATAAAVRTRQLLARRDAQAGSDRPVVTEGPVNPARPLTV